MSQACPHAFKMPKKKDNYFHFTSLLQSQALHGRGDNDWLKAVRGLSQAVEAGNLTVSERSERFSPSAQPFLSPTSLLTGSIISSSLYIKLWGKCFSPLILQRCPLLTISKYHSCNSCTTSISHSPFFCSLIDPRKANEIRHITNNSCSLGDKSFGKLKLNMNLVGQQFHMKILYQDIHKKTWK